MDSETSFRLTEKLPHTRALDVCWSLVHSVHAPWSKAAETCDTPVVPCILTGQAETVKVSGSARNIGAAVSALARRPDCWKKPWFGLVLLVAFVRLTPLTIWLRESSHLCGSKGR